MENAPYASRLRYLDANDVNDAVVDYDGLGVYGSDGHRIGDLDGFIIDAETRRVNYLVIDSGGWFTSRRLLLPIGHASLDLDRQSMQADVTREALGRLPEFEDDLFATLTDAELRAFERNTVLACCPDEPLEDVSETAWSYDARRHYRQPEWWRTGSYAPERLRVIGPTAYRTADPTAPIAPGRTSAAPTRDMHNRELMTAKDPSPHPDGRAQPGDVLGIETGGERTGIGETAEDEDTRRRTAERAAPKERPRRSDR